MGKGSRRGNREAFRERWDKIFSSSPRKPVNGTFVLRNGRLVRATPKDLRKHDVTNIVSLAAGVLPHQVADATKKIQEVGLSGVKYRPDGDVVFKDRQAKLRFMKYAGWHDRDEVRG